MKTEEYETKIKELSPKNFFPLIQKGILVSKSIMKDRKDSLENRMLITH